MDEPRWLTPAELAAWLRLMVVLETLPSALEHQLQRDADLNLFDYQIMAGLADSPNRILLMSDLAAFAVGSISRMSHAVSRLERSGYVERRTHEANRRHCEVALTDDGYEKLLAAAPGHVAHARAILVDLLSEEDLADLVRICDKLIPSLAPNAIPLMAEVETRLREAAVTST